MAEIGSIGPTRRTVAPSSPGVVADAFGSGVGRALGALQGTLQTRAQMAQGEAEAATTLDLAYKDRERKVTRSRLDVEFIKLTGELGRGVIDSYDASQPGAPGFTNSVNTSVSDAYAKFMQQVPQELKTDFAARVATATDSFVTQAFGLQTDSENTEFRRNVLQLQNDATNLLMSTTGDLDAAEAAMADNLNTLFDNSPLSTTETRNLREQATISLRSMKLFREATSDAQGLTHNGGRVSGALRSNGGVVSSDGPVAAGLPAVAVGLLKAVAGPESGFQYNRLYAPEGTRYFQDFSKHPNDPATIASGPHAGESSSAAGAYQDIKSTWDEVALDLGLTDFSPESQDLGNWHLAKKRFAEATGRDLEAVLSTGDPTAIIAAKRVLEGTWEGLKPGSMPDDKFVALIQGATGNPSSLINDPEYEIIPYSQRVSIIADAQKQAAAVQQQIAAGEQAKFDSAFDQLNKQIAAGEAGLRDIQNFQSIFPQATFADMEKLNETNKKYNETTVAATDFLTKSSGGLYTFDSGKASDREGQDAFLQSTNMREALGNRDETYVETVMLPTVQRSRMITPGIVQELQGMSLSQNQDSATFAFDTMNKLRVVNPGEFERAFGKETNQAIATFNAAKGNIPQEQLIQFLRNSQDPAMAQVYKLRQEQMTEIIKTNPDDFSAAGVSDALGLSNAPLGLGGYAMMAEYLPTYNYMYGILGDHEAAKTAAASVMASRWGEFAVLGKTQAMRYPPSITAQPFENSFDYVNDQLRTDFGLTDESNISLISDNKTEAEYLSGRSASYTVMLLDAQGLPQRPLTFSDLPDFNAREDGALANTIARFTPQVTPDMKAEQIRRVTTESELKGITDKYFFSPLRDLIAPPEVVEQQKQKTTYADPKFLAPIIRALGPARAGNAKDALITGLGKFKADSPQAMRAMLEELDGNLGNVYPVFQRWEVQRRIKELLKELPK